MDSGLSLGLNALTPSPHPAHTVLSAPWRLHDEKPSSSSTSSSEGEGETINFLGRPMCLKRHAEEQQQSCFPAKRLAVDSAIEARRNWGNQPLCVANPEIHEIMEKEKWRQFRGIELIASENFVFRAVIRERNRKADSMGVPGFVMKSETVKGRRCRS